MVVLVPTLTRRITMANGEVEYYVQVKPFYYSRWVTVPTYGGYRTYEEAQASIPKHAKKRYSMVGEELDSQYRVIKVTSEPMDDLFNSKGEPI